MIENDNSILINKSYDGHFYLPLSINKEIIFLVDTTTKSLVKKDYKLLKKNEINFTTEKIKRLQTER